MAPASKLSTLTWWADTTLGADLGVAAACTDDIYAAMDWLAERQDQIERQLAARHLAAGPNPARMALFDLSSSWLEGRCCPLAARGYSRDGKKGKLQIEYGLLTDPEGRPAAVRVFPGNTGDPAAFTAIVTVVRDKFGLEQMVMVGDRGMITSARIAALNQREDGTGPQDGYGWITALRAPAIKKLMADGGPLQLSLFDQQNLAEISHPDYPGERLIACRNPVLAADRARTRSELLAATEKLLAPIITRVAAGKLTGAGEIGVAVGKVISKYKTGKHFQVTITDTSLTVTRGQAQIDAEAALDGFYVLRTCVPAGQLDAPGVVTAYKNLKYVEMVFPQLTKGAVRPVGRGREHVADVDLVICDDHAVDEQLGQLPPLLEGSSSQAGPGGLAECLDAVGNGLQFHPLRGGGVELPLLGQQSGMPVVQVLAFALELSQGDDLSQVGVHEPLLLDA